jgi:hypothetical protein
MTVLHNPDAPAQWFLRKGRRGCNSRGGSRGRSDKDLLKAALAWDGRRINWSAGVWHRYEMREQKRAVVQKMHAPGAPANFLRKISVPTPSIILPPSDSHDALVDAIRQALAAKATLLLQPGPTTPAQGEGSASLQPEALHLTGEWQGPSSRPNTPSKKGAGPHLSCGRHQSLRQAWAPKAGLGLFLLARSLSVNTELAKLPAMHQSRRLGHPGCSGAAQCGGTAPKHSPRSRCTPRANRLIDVLGRWWCRIDFEP